MRKWITREGFADSGLWTRFRTGWPYYVFAFAYPAAVVPFALILATATGAQTEDLSAISVMSILQMALAAVVSVPIVWGEEFGWRSYLQIRLFERKPLLAALATGVIRALWHYPMILMGYVFSGDRLGLALYPINMAVTSIIYGWLFLRSGSIWTATLAHSVGNTVVNPLLESLLPDVSRPVVWAGYRLPALAVICLWILMRGWLAPRPETNSTPSHS